MVRGAGGHAALGCVGLDRGKYRHIAMQVRFVSCIDVWGTMDKLLMSVENEDKTYIYGGWEQVE